MRSSHMRGSCLMKGPPVSPPTLPVSPLPAAEQPAALARLVVRTTAEFTGRGPTKGRAHISQDLIAVVLEDTLTKGEQALVREGESKIVVESRRAFQRTMEIDLVAGVEAITGRKVRAFLSDHNTSQDVAVETFVLEPLPEIDGE